MKTSDLIIGAEYAHSTDRDMFDREHIRTATRSVVLGTGWSISYSYRTSKGGGSSILVLQQYDLKKPMPEITEEWAEQNLTERGNLPAIASETGWGLALVKPQYLKMTWAEYEERAAKHEAYWTEVRVERTIRRARNRADAQKILADLDNITPAVMDEDRRRITLTFDEYALLRGIALSKKEN